MATRAEETRAMVPGGSMVGVLASALATTGMVLGSSVLTASAGEVAVLPAAAVSVATPSEGGVAPRHGAARGAERQWRGLFCFVAPWTCD
ncbi:hypothetical protein ATL40_0092 [Serinibacter salmoneus]|uniref:Uncharacterized protein n=1 Tax=Serinibacter salmoneus TaxID=556530 RepID=A0A2A9CY07_9MICO|nr:hypothetical protein ATL40_0092 [Serinibacter salmoneus]